MGNYPMREKLYPGNGVLRMVREFVFGVGFALLLPVFFGLDGVLYSMPVSDFLTAFAGAVIICGTYKIQVFIRGYHII